MAFDPPPGRRHGIATAGLLLLAGGFLAGTAAASPGEAGLGHLVIVLEGSRLSITLDARAADVTGLDHPPANAAETTRLAEALKTLHSGDTLILMPPQAWCRPIAATVANPEAGGLPGAALQASWQFQCGAPAALHWIDAHLLAVFPGLRRLEASATTPAGIKSVVLTAGTPRMLLPRASSVRQ